LPTERMKLCTTATSWGTEKSAPGYKEKQNQKRLGAAGMNLIHSSTPKGKGGRRKKVGRERDIETDKGVTSFVAAKKRRRQAQSAFSMNSGAVQWGTGKKTSVSNVHNRKNMITLMRKTMTRGNAEAAKSHNSDPKKTPRCRTSRGQPSKKLGYWDR